MLAGKYLRATEDGRVCAAVIADGKVPSFDAKVYTPSKARIGAISEVYGQLNSPCFAISLDVGFKTTGFKEGDTFYIPAHQLIPA